MADESEVMALHLRIRGRVQGVFFRRWVMEEATRRGIRGWVRNRADGSVEAVLAGEMGAVRAMAEACRQGPSGAQVAGIVQCPGEFTPTDDDLGETFRLLPDV